MRRRWVASWWPPGCSRTAANCRVLVEKRRVEWTPDVSARAWELTLSERDAAVEVTAVVLVATGAGDHGDVRFGLILASLRWTICPRDQISRQSDVHHPG